MNYQKKERRVLVVKQIGIVRKIDNMGRIVLPIELRNTLGVGEKDPLEFQLDGEGIRIKPHSMCTFCGRNQNLVRFKEKMVCRVCLEGIKSTHRIIT